MSKKVHDKEPYRKFKNDKEVLVVNAEDINKIKEELEKLIEDPNIANSIGSNGHDAYCHNEQNEGYLDKTIQIYKSLLP